MSAELFAGLTEHGTERTPRRRARRLHAAIAAIVQPMEARVLLSAALIKDINTTNADANPRGFVVSNGQLYFTATVGVSPIGSLDGGTSELWKTDGTSAGTVPVGNLVPGAYPTIQDLTDVNGTLYFLATGPNDGKGAGLYRSDGAVAGTIEVMSFPGSDFGYGYGDLTNFNGTLFFTDGAVLWKSNGTPAGTFPIDTIPVATAEELPGGVGDLTPVGNTLYFVGTDGRLWKTDGTTAGTVDVGQLSDLSSSANLYPSDLTPFDGQLYFLSQGSLWKTDGTATGTQLVSPFFDPGSVAQSLFDDQGTLLFETTEVGTGHTASIWKSDGTTGGTVKIAEPTLPGALQSFYSNFAELNGTVYFAGSDTTHGVELWRSDGTAAGTTLLDDINPGPASGIANEVLGPKEQFISFDGKIYFSATDGVHGQQLWQTDGTAAGTFQFAQINTATNGSSPSDATNPDQSGGVSYFVADDGIHGPEVWQTDGTSAGTEMLTDINAPGSGDTVGPIGPLFANDGAVFFTDNTGSTDNVYVIPQPDAAPAELSSGSYGVGFTAMGGKVYMLQEPADGSGSASLYVTDGTAPGTRAIVAVGAGGSLGGGAAMADVNGTLFFSAFDSSGQMSIWKSDGTQAGTSQVASFQGTASFSQDFVAIGNELYFIANNGANGPALWKSDGTAGGTSMVWQPGSAGVPDHFVAFNGNLYFSVLDTRDSDSNGVYKTDGTTAGTVLLSSATNLSISTAAFGKLYFTGVDPSSNSFKTYTTDGTVAGTIVSPSVIPVPPFSANGAAYFVSENELWETDGTNAWLADPSEVSNGPSISGNAAFLGPLDGGLLFVGGDSAHGQEPWLFTPVPSAPPPPTSALVPTLGTTDLPTAVGSGSKFNARVPVVVTNSGAPLKGLVTVNLYADAGTTLDGNRVLVATEKRHGSVKSNQKVSFNLKVKTLPASLADGTYHLIAQVVDPSGNVNSVATSQTVQLSAAAIQPSLSFAPVTPATITPGRSGSVLITLSNNGTIASTGGSLVLRLSADGVDPVPGVTLVTRRSGLRLAPGQSRQLRLRFHVPRKLRAGTYYSYALLTLNGVAITVLSPSTFTVS